MATASACFVYNGKTYMKTTLADLAATQPLSEQLLKEGDKPWRFVTAFFEGRPTPNTLILPIRLQESLGFEAIVRAEDEAAIKQLRAILTPEDRLTFCVRLRGLHKRPVV